MTDYILGALITGGLMLAAIFATGYFAIQFMAWRLEKERDDAALTPPPGVGEVPDPAEFAAEVQQHMAARRVGESSAPRHALREGQRSVWTLPEDVQGPVWPSDEDESGPGDTERFEAVQPRA